MGPGRKLGLNFFSKNDFYHVMKHRPCSSLNFARHAAWEDSNPLNGMEQWKAQSNLAGSFFDRPF